MSSKTVLKSKRVSYGFVELVDWGIASLKYAILVDNVIKEQSNDLNFLTNRFESYYH